MLALEIKTKKKPDKILQKLKDYFGSTGLKLEIARENENGMLFKGSGGYVEATIVTEDSKTRVNLESSEWDYHIKKFAEGL